MFDLMINEIFIYTRFHVRHIVHARAFKYYNLAFDRDLFLGHVHGHRHDTLDLN